MIEKEILIIEDNTAAAILVQSVIEQAGYKHDFKIASSCKEAINQISHYENIDSFPEIIILDLYLPGLNGWDFLERISKHSPKLKSKIVILTTSIRREDLVKATKFPQVIGYYNKPITITKAKDLMAKLRKAQES